MKALQSLMSIVKLYRYVPTPSKDEQYLSIPRSASKAVGTLEMGGGSTQITFHPDGPVLANMFSLRVAGKIYDLYSHSYLYYGQKYMRLRVIEYLFNDTSNEILNPCWLKGMYERYISIF